MECYEGATMIKTYRGMLVDGGQDRINLKTLKGEIGYKIKTFIGFPNLPGTTDYESVLMLWKIKQTSISTTTATVDFTDGDLLGSFYFAGTGSYLYSDGPQFAMFEEEVFNQDIYITHTNTEGAAAANYYLELEQVSLNENESTMATLQSLRRLGLPRN